ncbi:MAG TPA: DUF3084 domain-containing protein [Candidatus Acidoferrales bacterium]|nr:DUF3084 domain-containing protein [Candidatus Acidoferrales bacterium]
MNLVEFVRGVFNVLVVMLIAGGVAYVGDRVGHQVGRKRLSLFGLRPRYTSTIIAIATGMIIALVVTLVAILASHEVQTAFFKLSSLNQQIAELQSRESNLEAKVNNGKLVFPVDRLMVPFYRIVDKSADSAQRLATIRTFYYDVVKFVNSNYQRLGLRAYAIPPDVDKRLQTVADNAKIASKDGTANVMLTATSDQNLFQNDQIHFGINSISDERSFRKGDIIAQLTIPGHSGASMSIAIGELEQYVTITAERLNLPPFLAENVEPLQLYPDVGQMQTIVARAGTYVLTAYAAEDFYPHLGGIPIVIALARQPGV